MASDIEMATEDASTAPIAENPQPQIALNFDTLAAVMPWIEKRKDLLSFISTSADLYSAGIPVLLGFPYGLSLRNLSSLHQFLTSKGPQSFLGLRELHLSFLSYSEDTTMDADAIAQLTDILSRAKNLQNLSIDGDVLHMYPALYEILASYSSLHSLDLLWAQGANHQTLLKQLQAPLTYLLFEGSEGDLHVTSALANFSSTLEDLTISTYTLCHSPAAGPVYPKLAHLRLTTVYNPQLSILIPAFPNLQTLSISINYSPHTMEQMEGCRESNLQFQADRPSQRWFLSSLAGEGGGLYTLALQTGVPDVEVFNFAPELDVEDLRVSLAPLRPMQLKIDSDEDPISGADWISTAISTGWTELTRLELSFALAEIDDLSPSYEEGLDRLFGELALVATSKPFLTLLSVNIVGDDDAADFLEGLESRTLAARTAQAIPTLNYIQLTVLGHTFRKSYWTHNEAELMHIAPEAHAALDKAIAGSMASLLQRYHRREQNTRNVQ